MARQPVTLLYESGLEGVEDRPNLLLAGTANKLARYSVDGSWTLMHSVSFCDDGDWISSRFLCAQLAGLCLVAHTRGGFWDLTFNAVPTGTDDGYTYLTPNDSLIALGIESARIVVQSKGFFFVAGLVVGGVEQPSLAHWSGFESTNFIPGGDSEAGYISLGGGKLLAAEELGNGVVFYTDRAIWLATYVGGDTVWAFDRIYSGPDVPTYPRSVVNCGDFHAYVTSNSIRLLFRGERTPREFDWLNKASGCMFNGIRSGLLDGMPAGSVDGPSKISSGCLHLVGWYNPIDKLIGFSWADRSSVVPNWTILLSIDHKTACLVDHGITAAVMTQQPLPGTEESLRAFLTRTMGCEAKPDINEHDPFPEGYPEAGEEPAHLYNATEDPSLGPDDDSYCSIIEASDSPCLTHCSPCAGPLRMIFASAEDYCLKEFRWDFDRREELDTIEDPQEWNNAPVDDQKFSAEGPNPVAAATYRIDSYLTLFQSDLFITGDGGLAYIKSVSVAMVPMDTGADMTDELVPSIAMPWPSSGQGCSAESAKCVSWNLVDVDQFACGVASDLPSYVRGAENPELHIEVEGRYVAYRIYWGGSLNIGPVAFTGLTVEGQSIRC